MSWVKNLIIVYRTQIIYMIEIMKFLRLQTITGALFSVTEITTTMMIMMTAILLRMQTKWHKSPQRMNQLSSPTRAVDRTAQTAVCHKAVQLQHWTLTKNHTALIEYIFCFQLQTLFQRAAPREKASTRRTSTPRSPPAALTTPPTLTSVLKTKTWRRMMRTTAVTGV